MALPPVYLSGGFDLRYKEQKKLLKRSGCKHRCFSFAFLDEQNKLSYSKQMIEALKACKDAKTHLMLDSGAASIHGLIRSTQARGERARNKQAIDIDKLKDDLYGRYIQYVKKEKKDWDFYITLDFRKDQKLIWKMQQRFLNDGLDPVPVFHGDVSVEWLKRYMDIGHKFFGLGSLALRKGSWSKEMRYLDTVFDFGAKHGLTFHGLAVTRMSIYLRYPWYCTDSATWTKTASFGCIMWPDLERNTFCNVHVSEKHSSVRNSYNNLNRKHRQMIAERVRELGFDMEELRRSNIERETFNAYMFAHLDELITNLDNIKEKEISWETLI